MGTSVRRDAPDRRSATTRARGSGIRRPALSPGTASVVRPGEEPRPGVFERERGDDLPVAVHHGFVFERKEIVVLLLRGGAHARVVVVVVLLLLHLHLLLLRALRRPRGRRTHRHRRVAVERRRPPPRRRPRRRPLGRSAVDAPLRREHALALDRGALRPGGRASEPAREHRAQGGVLVVLRGGARLLRGRSVVVVVEGGASRDGDRLRALLPFDELLKAAASRARAGRVAARGDRAHPPQLRDLFVVVVHDARRRGVGGGGGALRE
eukprot:29739-Pelagococcus_subviridis.AAC.4